MVGEAVADVAEAALLDVLLDGVEGLLLGDLHLGVGPAGDLYDHVEDAIVLVGEEGDVMERRDNGAVLLEEHAVLCVRKSVRDRQRDMWHVHKVAGERGRKAGHGEEYLGGR